MYMSPCIAYLNDVGKSTANNNILLIKDVINRNPKNLSVLYLYQSCQTINSQFIYYLPFVLRTWTFLLSFYVICVSDGCSCNRFKTGC